MLRLFARKNFWFYLLIGIGLLLLIGEIINGRLKMHDLEVYYKTANRFVQGQELYRIQEDGHFVFKYSPTSALYFVPFLPLSFFTAKVFYWVLLTFVVAVIFQVFYQLVAGKEEIQTPSTLKNQVLLLTFLAVGTHVHREWHLGQVNLLLLVLFTLMVQSVMQNQYKTAAFLLAFSLFLKPFGLIFMPFFFLKKKYKTLLYTLVFVVLLGILPLLFYSGVAGFKQLYFSWFQELAIELNAKQRLLQPGNHTVFSVLARFTPLRYLVVDSTAAKIYQLVLMGIIGLIFLVYMQKGRLLKQPMVAEGAVLIAMIPLFAFTSLNAFLFAVPCLIFLFYNAKILNLLGKTALGVAGILIGINIRDLVGAELYKFFEDTSIYTFGTLILLGLMFSLRLKLAKAEALTPVEVPSYLANKPLVN